MKSLIIPVLCVLALQQLSCNGPGNSTTSTPLKISDQGVNIAYTDTGKSDTALLFVHGWGINKSYWKNQVDHFSKNYRVVAIDLPGFGESGKNRSTWTTESYGRDIDSVISQLHLKKVILIGHSMAGDIVLQAAGNSAVIGFVGVDNFKNVAYTPTAKDKKDEAEAMVQMKKHFKSYASEYFNQALFYTTTADSIKKRILNDIVHDDSLTATAAIFGGDDFNEMQKLKEVKKKLNLINSDYTPTDTAALVKEHIPYQLYFVHATGHFPMVEKPGEFNAALEKIIAKL